jgi:hypothetical protein
MGEMYNEELYVMAPIYSTRNKIDPLDKNVFKIYKNKVCNMRDVQATFGGKAKIEEPFNFAATREVLEESGIFFDPSSLSLFCSHKENSIVTNCYHSRITCSISDHKYNDDRIDLDPSKNISCDDLNRKVCVSIYGTFDEICDVLTTSTMKDMDDNIIALMILPIDIAIKIDLNGHKFANQMKNKRDKSNLKSNPKSNPKSNLKSKHKSYRKLPKLL